MIWLRSMFDTNKHRFTVIIELEEEDGSASDRFELRDMGIYAYCDAVLMAAGAAETEAAITRQLHEKLELPLENVVVFIQQFRKRRPRMLDPFAKATRYGVGTQRANAAGILTFNPIVSATTGEGVVQIYGHGQQIGQWDIPAAKLHAANVLDVWSMTQLDQTYIETLTEVLELSEGRALNVVSDLLSFRPID